MARCLSAGLSLLFVCIPFRGWADCGSIPLYKAPLTPGVLVVEAVGDHIRDMSNRQPSVDFDPLKVTVFEPKQRAIILWNGEEEILLLSTDQSITPPASVLEVIPFPSEPTLKLGSFDTFHRAQDLVVRKRTWAVAHGGARADAVTIPEEALRVAFEEQLGVHDLAVVEARSRESFGEAVSKYLMEKYQLSDHPIRPEFLAMIDGYIADGYRFFAFDKIDLSDRVKSREPIEYRFATPKMFYPLRISTLEKGETTVEALVLSRQLLTNYHGLPKSAFDGKAPLKVTREELKVMEPAWEGFFGEDAGDLVLQQWELRGDVSKFEDDVLMD